MKVSRLSNKSSLEDNQLEADKVPTVGTGQGRGYENVIHKYGSTVRETRGTTARQYFYLLMERVYPVPACKRSGEENAELFEALNADCLGDEEKQAVARAIGEAAGEGLLFMHTQLQVAHLDVKPENVLVGAGRAGAGLTIKLIDFGSARPIGEDASASEELGTEGYSAPEMYQDGRPGASVYDPSAADVFAYGATLYVLGTLSFPFVDEADTRSVETEPRWDNAAQLDASVAPGSWSLIRDMLSKEPKNRPTLKEVLEELDHLLDPDTRAVAGRRAWRHRAEAEAHKAGREPPTFPERGCFGGIGRCSGYLDADAVVTHADIRGLRMYRAVSTTP